MTEQARAIREQNIEAIVDYFKSGIKDQTDNALGIELEHTLISAQDGSPVSYASDQGVLSYLQEFSSDYPNLYHDVEGDLLGASRPGEAITLEPASQLELSAGPFRDLKSAALCFLNFEEKLDAMAAARGHKVICTGYHPTSRAEDLTLIPKRRYDFMNRYLGAISKFGPCMMRGSASTQISIDYHSEQDCLRKFKIAGFLTPILSLICDNSPVFEGKMREHELVRTEIWEKCDPARCGIVPNSLQADFSWRAYAEYLLSTPAILIPCETEEWCYAEKTFGEIYADRVMTRAEVEHCVSMFFNDVRLKTYVEIRPADALPIPYAIAYAGIIKGIFYSDAMLQAFEQDFEGLTVEDVNKAKAELMKLGYKAKVYGKPVREWADLVISRAQTGLSEAERAFIDPLADLVRRRLTLASIMQAAATGTTDSLIQE